MYQNSMPHSSWECLNHDMFWLRSHPNSSGLFQPWSLTESQGHNTKASHVLFCLWTNPWNHIHVVSFNKFGNSMFMGLGSNDLKNSVSSKLSQFFLGFSFFSPLPKALLPFFSNPFSYLYCLHHLYSWSSILLKLFFCNY